MVVTLINKYIYFILYETPPKSNTYSHYLKLAHSSLYLPTDITDKRYVSYLIFIHVLSCYKYYLIIREILTIYLKNNGSF